MCETRFMRICVLKERREKERNVKNKWEKKKKMRQRFSVHEINFPVHKRIPPF